MKTIELRLVEQLYADNIMNTDCSLFLVSVCFEYAVVVELETSNCLLHLGSIKLVLFPHVLKEKRPRQIQTKCRHNQVM